MNASEAGETASVGGGGDTSNVTVTVAVGAGLPVVPVTTCVTVPTLVAVGGLGLETIVFWVILELFLTVILS